MTPKDQPSRKRKPYDWNLSIRLRSYYHRHILPNHNNIGCPTLLYLVGIPLLEQWQKGCCKEIKVTYPNLAYHSGLSVGSIRKHLLDLQRWGLIELHIGQREPKRSTRIRRLTPEEIKGKGAEGPNAPEHAITLAAVMSQRSFRYGDADEPIHPQWSAAKTGRIMSSKPSVQKDNPEVRMNSLKAGLERGEFLFELDIKQAEPAVILHRLKQDNLFSEAFDGDLYTELAHLIQPSPGEKRWDRKKAKNELNKLTYARISQCEYVATNKWKLPQGSGCLRYVQAVDRLRGILWKQGRPSKELRRHVTTIGGSVIQSNVRERTPVHPGRILNWYAQGSIAEITNGLTRHLLIGEQKGKLRFLFPVHDCFYIALKDRTKIGWLKQKLETFIENDYGITLQISVKPTP